MNEPIVNGKVVLIACLAISFLVLLSLLLVTYFGETAPDIPLFDDFSPLS